MGEIFVKKPDIYNEVKTPCYIVDEALLKKNLSRLRYVKERTGCAILLAQKAFSMYYFYPLISEYIDGATSSGLYEARLCNEEMKGENHVFSPAYKKEDMEELVKICDHIVLNSFAQWEKYGEIIKANRRHCSIRINPECSTQGHAIYDPCAPGSRLGVTLENFEKQLKNGRLPEGIDGLHFHCLCEQNADALETTLSAVEKGFGRYFEQIKWLNFGGGHHITRDDYDLELLISLICRIQDKYGVRVYLEPGEAVALNAGYLVTTVLELVHNGMDIAIVDTSAACHMPDVIEMPYRPPLCDSGPAGSKGYTYRIGGPTCLAGDIIGDYSFDEPLKEGDRLVFGDMAIYSMVKNNTFNGMPLPDIIALSEDGSCKVVKRFSYEDFKRRL